MIREPQNTVPNGDDDSWDQLAEDLLGVERPKHEPVSPPEVTAPEEPSPAILPEAALHREPETISFVDEIEREVEPEASPLRAVSEHADIDIEDMDFESEPVASEPPAPDYVEDVEELEEGESAAAAKAPGDDNYWDALANFSWQEEEGGEASAKSGGRHRRDRGSEGPRSGRGAPSSKSRPSAPAGRGEHGRGETGRGEAGRGEAPSGRTRGGRPERSSRAEAPRETGFSEGLAEPELVDEWLEEEIPPVAPRASERASEVESRRGETPSDEGESADRKKKRRRRRRKGRGPESRTEEVTPVRMNEEEGFLEEEEEFEPVAEEFYPEEEVEEPAFEEPAFEEEVEEVEEERPAGRSRSRRRGGRRRGGQQRPAPAAPANLEPEEEEEELEVPEYVEELEEEFEELPEPVSEHRGGAFDASLEEEEEETEDSEHEPVPNYRDVPTWEEAISFMLNPPHLDSGSGSRGGPGRGGPESGGRPQGHRGGGRRPNRGSRGPR